MSKKQKPNRAPVKIEGEIRTWYVEYGIVASCVDTVKARSADEAWAIVMNEPEMDPDETEIDERFDSSASSIKYGASSEDNFNRANALLILQDIKDGLHSGYEPDDEDDDEDEAEDED